jgi:hypothetical protein
MARHWLGRTPECATRFRRAEVRSMVCPRHKRASFKRILRQGLGRLSGGGCTDPTQLLKGRSKPPQVRPTITARGLSTCATGCSRPGCRRLLADMVGEVASRGAGSAANFVRLWTLGRAGLTR